MAGGNREGKHHSLTKRVCLERKIPCFSEKLLLVLQAQTPTEVSKYRTGSLGATSRHGVLWIECIIQCLLHVYPLPLGALLLNENVMFTLVENLSVNRGIVTSFLGKG